MTPEEKKAHQKEQRKERQRLLKEQREQDRIATAKWKVEQYELQQRIEREAMEQKYAVRTLRIIRRGLIDVLAWDTHERGRNWAAIVEIDPLMPGGIRRVWFERGSGHAKYIIPEQLLVGHVIEFGADYFSWRGKRKRERIYAAVTHLSDTEVAVKPYSTLLQAQSHKMVRIADVD